MNRSANLPVYLVIFFFFFCHQPTQAGPLYADPFEMLRAGRWSDILSYFQSRHPEDKSDFFALARAMQESRNYSGLSAVQRFMNVVQRGCMQDDTEIALQSCLSKIPEDSVGELLERLALYRAQEAGYKSLSQSSREAILARGRLYAGDPLDHRILQKRLDILIDNKQYSRAVETAYRYDGLHSDYTDFLRARSLRLAGKCNEATDAYFKAAEQDPPGWLNKAIYFDLKKCHSGLPESLDDRPELQRKLVLFQQYIPSSYYKSREAFSPSRLIATSSMHTVARDGMVLLEMGDDAAVIELSSRAYTYLSSNPDKLRWWMYQLKQRNQWLLARRLFERFEHAKTRDPALWHLYLEVLKHSGDQEAYFKELVAYLNENHADYETHDELIAFLIGDDPQKLHWADNRYWEYAKAMMPAQSGSGRFIYWLYRYYQDKSPREEDDLRENFYSHMPGSYYKAAFWDLNHSEKQNDFRQAWNQVRDTKTYLKWVSIYGGNENARKFLEGKNLSAYWNPEAVRILRDLKKDQDDVPDDIVDLFRLGEWQLGMDFFRQTYSGKVSEYQFLRRLAQAGLRSETLFVSVYYTRNLLRASKVAEDPFTLPPELLSILYPRPYHAMVQKYTRDFGVDEAMLYGLMRQESMFRELAVSKSGAKGLMQIMPRTGEWLASRSGMKNYDLLDPETSIRMGSMFFADLLRMYDQDFRWASIAYNGGPGNLKKWKATYYRGDFNHFLEHIPKAESRNYCRITHQNFMHYRISQQIYGSRLN